MEELIGYDDLFMLAFYTGTKDDILTKDEVASDRLQTGNSHVVLLYKNLIIRINHPVMMTRYGCGAVRAQA